MTQATRRRALSLIGSAALVGCTEPSLDMVSQNLNDPFEGGIGGTGIVGVLNGFGSLLVNGLRVELTGRTRFSTAFGSIEASDLQRGMPLTVFAFRNRRGTFAENVRVDYALVGRARRHAGGFTVNGVPVHLEAGSIGALAEGRRVAISGIWTASGVSASRIDAAPEGPDLLAGTVGRAGNAYTIGSVPISARQNALKAGEYAVILGKGDDDGFAASAIERGRFSGASRLDQLSVEGYLEPSENAPGFRIAGLGHSFARDLKLSQIERRRAVYFGNYTGRFGALRAYGVPDSFAERGPILSSTSALLEGAQRFETK